MMTKPLCRNELLNIIDKTSFAMDDTRLFLDTHPNCQEALEFFQIMKVKRERAIEEYTKAFGPIRSYDVAPCDVWKWNMGPWPWQASYREGRN